MAGAGIAGLALFCGALVVCGCDKSEVEPEDVDPGTVASKVAGAEIKPQPGRWETSLRIVSVDLPDMPPEAKAKVEGSLDVERRLAFCLTADAAARPDAAFFNEGKTGCTFEHFNMADGRLAGTMSCSNDAGRILQTLAGEYTAESYTVHATSRINMAGGREMTASVVMNSRRAGDCKGDEVGALKSQ